MIEEISQVPNRKFPDHSRTGWGHTYFVRRGDEIKIGFSGAPHQRIRGLGKIDEVLAIVPNTLIGEGPAHEKFAHLRLHHEWFRAAPELLDYIEEIKPLAPEFADKGVPWKKGRSSEVAKAIERLHSMRIRAPGNLPISARISIAISLLKILDDPEEGDHHDGCRRRLAFTMRELEERLGTLPKDEGA